MVTVHGLLRLLLNGWLFAVDDASSSVIVGLNKVSQKLAYEFKRNPLREEVCMGFFDDRGSERLSEKSQQQSETLLGRVASVAEFVKTHNVKHIYIALPMFAQPPDSGITG